MRNFLLSLLLFCVPISLLILSAELYVRFRPSGFAQKKEQLLDNAENMEVLIVGSSHAMHGIIPEQLTLNAQNIAYGSQTIYFDKRIIEKYLPRLKKLKYVVLDLDYSSLYIDHAENRDFFYKYYYDIDFKDRKFFKEFFLQSFFVYSPKQTVRLLKDDIWGNEADIAGKKWLGSEEYQEDVSSLEKNKGRAQTFNNDIDNYKGGNEILKDLESLIAILKSKHITPIVLSYPVYPVMRTFYYKKVLEKNKQINDYLVQKYGVIYLDYGDDDSFIISDYYDCDHLNKPGADKLTQRLDSVIMTLER
jgi:hypothetical protein